MEYSITSLAKKARVTVRTLRHYDQIGLLKPSIRMSNGKRVYSDEQAMRLFEIVFFKKIGIGLRKVKEIFRSKDCHQAVAAALIARRQELAKEIKKLQRYTTTIDTILPQYKNCSWSHKERLEKFSQWLNVEKEIEDIQIKEFGKELVEKAKEKIDALSEEQVDELQDRSNKLMKIVVKAVERGLDPESNEAQEMVKQYYELLTEFHPVTREIFFKLRNLVLEQRELYSAYHPQLPDLLYKAMGIFAAEFFQHQKDE